MSDWMQQLRSPNIQNRSRPKMERGVNIRINTFYPAKDQNRRVNVKKGTPWFHNHPYKKETNIGFNINHMYKFDESINKYGKFYGKHSYYERETTWQKYGPKRNFNSVVMDLSPSSNLLYKFIHIGLLMRRRWSFVYLWRGKMPVIEQVPEIRRMAFFTRFLLKYQSSICF